MKVGEVISTLRKHDVATELEELAEMGTLSGDFWKALVCTGLKALQGSGAIRLDGEQSVIFNVILSQICGG